MSNLYHINPETGNPGKCSASQGKCPFGSVDNHYTSEAAARTAFESDHSAFAKKTGDLSTLLPDWHGKLPETLEQRIAKQWEKDAVFLAAVKSGTIETKYASIEEFITPPVYAQRSRGTYFATLSEINGESDEDTPKEMFPDELYVAIHARQGGGNRECYCDEYGEEGHEDGCLALNNEMLERHPQHFRNEDDDFDSTYATFYYRTGSTKADRDKNREQLETLSKANSIAAYQKAVRDGVVPPWSNLAKDNSAHAAYASAKQAHANATRASDELIKKSTLATEGLALVKSLDDLDPAKLKEIADVAGYSRWSQDNFARDLKNYRDSTKKLQRMEAMVAQAEALPDGELKEHLLGDRGTGSYNTTEKQGRRNVTVKKTYEKGSLLGSDLKSAKQVHESNSKTLKAPLDKLKVAVSESKAAIQERAKADKTLETARQKAWLSGWPGTKESAPPVGEKF